MLSHFCVPGLMKSENGMYTTMQRRSKYMAGWSAVPEYQRACAAGCRWASAGWEGVRAAGRLFNALAAKDQWGRPVVLFRNEYALSSLAPDAVAALGELAPYALPPDSA